MMPTICLGGGGAPGFWGICEIIVNIKGPIMLRKAPIRHSRPP